MQQHTEQRWSNSHDEGTLVHLVGDMSRGMGQTPEAPAVQDVMSRIPVLCQHPEQQTQQQKHMHFTLLPSL